MKTIPRSICQIPPLVSDSKVISEAIPGKEQEALYRFERHGAIVGGAIRPLTSGDCECPRLVLDGHRRSMRRATKGNAFQGPQSFGGTAAANRSVIQATAADALSRAAK